MKKWVVWGILLIPMILSAVQMQVVTSEYPPFNFEKDQQIQGLCTEFVQEMLKDANIETSIELYSWARAYSIALEKPNVIIYSIVRTPERESLFHWIGDIVPNKVFLFSSSKWPHNLNNLEDAKKYTIGTNKDDFREVYLLKKGFQLDKSILRGYSFETNLKNLLSGRIQLIAENEFFLSYALSVNNYDKNLIKKQLALPEISKTGLGIAVSKKTSPEIVSKLKKAYIRVKNSSRYQKILNKYQL